MPIDTLSGAGAASVETGDTGGLLVVRVIVDGLREKDMRRALCAMGVRGIEGGRWPGISIALERGEVLFRCAAAAWRRARWGAQRFGQSRRLVL